jgi:hypothetical protein
MAYQKSVSLHFFKNRKPPLCFQWVADRGPQKRAKMRYAYDLKDRFSRLRAAGFMTMEEMASRLRVQALKRLALPAELLTARPKRLRFLILNTPGKLIHHARRTILRLARTANRFSAWRRALGVLPLPAVT